MDDKRKVQELRDKVKKFCEDRDWDQFHGIKDLAIALSIEASELLEIFRWKTNEEVEEILKNPEKREEISDELADILYFLARMSQMYDFDLSEALDKKLEKNDKKYPVDKAFGSSKKYTEFEE